MIKKTFIVRFVTLRKRQCACPGRGCG